MLDLIGGAGATLVGALAAYKVVYYCTTQLWMDVTFMQEMVNRGADSESECVQKTFNGF